jgi:hypothetical protein
MRPRRSSLWFVPLLALAAAQLGCPTERQPPPKEAPVPEDPWSNIPPSKEWLYATGGFNGPHKAECDHVLGWVKGEDACKASLCEHGVTLAREWTQRCGTLVDPGLVASVRSVEGQITPRMSQAPTECAARLHEIVENGCGDGAACLAAGQRWATRCAKGEGTPLVMRMLQRTIERRMEQGSEPVKLDVRTCDELAADVLDAAKCKDRFACAEAIPRVQAYRDRCESKTERPALSTAVAEATILFFGTKPPAPILVRADAVGVKPGELPVTLDDKSGAVVTVCDERASDLARYVNARRGCTGGRMVVARAFPSARGAEVRVGSLDFPDDATFSTRYPTIVGAGELDFRDGEAAKALDAELAKAAAAGGAEAGRLVAKAVLENVLSIRRSPRVRAVLSKRDDALVPALREIARAKLAATRARVPMAEAAGLVNRGRVRAFADLAPDGTVAIGSVSRALTLDTRAFLPRATDALGALLRARRVGGPTAKAERARGMAAAQACGAALRRLSETKRGLVSCNFGLEACDEAKHAALRKSIDEARVAAEEAFRDLETARTSATDEADALTRAATSAGCREPWW